MSTSAASLALPTLTLRTRQPYPLQYFSSSSISLIPNSKPISISTVFLKPTLPFSYSSNFVRRVAVSSELDQDEDTFSDGDSPSFSPDLKLFVGNLPFSVDSAQLAELFESAGNVEVVEVMFLFFRSLGFEGFFGYPLGRIEVGCGLFLFFLVFFFHCVCYVYKLGVLGLC